MTLFYVLLVVLLIFFIPIPIKLSIYYSTVNYYVKLYTITLISKKKNRIKKKALENTKTSIKHKHSFFSNIYSNIDLKSIISILSNLKIKPILRIKLSFDYSLNDAAKTAISYGLLYSMVPLSYTFLSNFFNINKFNFNINPIFEDKLLLKIETSSIIFLSFANIIYIIINLIKNNIKQGR